MGDGLVNSRSLRQPFYFNNGHHKSVDGLSETGKRLNTKKLKEEREFHDNRLEDNWNKAFGKTDHRGDIPFDKRKKYDK